MFSPYENFDDIELSPRVAKNIIRFYGFCFGMAIFYLLHN